MWATSRRAALARLRHAVDSLLPGFGPYQDAMLTGDWHLAHTIISPYLNLGLLLPGEVCDAVEDAYRAGAVPIASCKGQQPGGSTTRLWSQGCMVIPAGPGGGVESRSGESRFGGVAPFD